MKSVAASTTFPRARFGSGECLRAFAFANVRTRHFASSTGLCAMPGQQIVGLDVNTHPAPRDRADELDRSKLGDLNRGARLPLAFLIPKTYCPDSIGRG